MTITTLVAFLGASLLLTIAPGPDNTFVVAQGISRGRRAAVITALGMCSGVRTSQTPAVPEGRRERSDTPRPERIPR